jgi:hypothetical protein
MNAKSRTILACAFALLLPVAATAQAGTDTPRFDARQARQADRIEQGVASGALTAREAARLQRGQDHLQNVENQVKADGVVTRHERARLEHAADVQSKRIYRQKHDRQHDYNHDGRIDRPARAPR